jgi:hypothetical protein
MVQKKKLVLYLFDISCTTNADENEERAKIVHMEKELKKLKKKVKATRTIGHGM